MVHFTDLKLNHKQPVYIQISHYVKKQIMLGRFRLGDKLPSRREIAAQLSVNPNTVQKTFKLMEDEGYVLTSGNQGSVIFVNEEIFNRIQSELTEGMVKEFIYSAKEINLSFKKSLN